MASHPARCPRCKPAVESLLRSIFGAVEPGWASGWPCSRADLAGTPAATTVLPIYDALVAHRGHSTFVRRPRLPSCDYFVPGEPGFIVEYDETQHFTAPRAITLSLIPAAHPLAFDRDRWLRLATEVNAHDNDPPFRDEQRAWYDLLRDVLPAHNGLGPTSRVLDREVAYCLLDPGNAADRASFEAMLNRHSIGGANG